ncbi:hypothetical protein M2273_000859 [Mucilaginibacter lappiensis]
MDKGITQLAAYFKVRQEAFNRQYSLRVSAAKSNQII